MRQILVAEALVDIQTNSAYKYTMKFFRPSDIDTKSNGLYTLKGGIQPFKTIVVENPSADPATNYDTLRITEIVNSTTTVSEYQRTEVEGNPKWTLTTGNGSKKETLTLTEGEDIPTSHL